MHQKVLEGGRVLSFWGSRSFPSVGPIEHSHRTNFQRWYEFEGKGPQGQELDVEISEDGERILIQTDTAG